MSSKKNLLKQKGPVHVPRLRFREFSGRWKPTSLEGLLEVYIERVPSETSLRVYSSSRTGLRPQDQYYDGSELLNEGEYRVVPCDCFVYRHMSDDGVFKFNVNRTGAPIAVSKEYPVFRAQGVYPEFLFQILNESQEFARYAMAQKKGGTRTRLYFSTLCAWKPRLPSIQEQQKIAECLSSIDELIAAETRKLTALKTYKKGLMQQLFPAEGKAVPQLRIPAFRKAKDWKVCAFRELVSRSFYGTSSRTSDSGAYPVLRMGNMIDGSLDIGDLTFIDLTEGEFSKFELMSGDILLNRTNSIDLVGKISLFELNGKYVAASYLVIFRLKRGVIAPEFLNYLLNSDSYQKRIRGLATRAISQANINPTAFQEKLTVSFPSLPEQKSVSFFLSSIDNLIRAQAQDIDALRIHKQGLIQQLFPVVEEVKS